MGLSDGTDLTFSDAGDTSGYGDLLDGRHFLYDGDFNGDGKDDELFGYGNNGDLFVGASDGAALVWDRVGNTVTAGLGQIWDRDHRVLAGDFTGDGKTDLLLHDRSNGEWQMGVSDGADITWHAAGATTGFGDLLDLRHRLYVGDFNGDGKDDVMAYDSGRGLWWLGASDGTSLVWSEVDDTHLRGDLIDPSRRLFFADYDGDGELDTMSHDAGGSWSLRPAATDPLAWHPAGDTSSFGDLTR
jgi:hypothetical protein